MVHLRWIDGVVGRRVLSATSREFSQDETVALRVVVSASKYGDNPDKSIQMIKV